MAEPWHSKIRRALRADWLLDAIVALLALSIWRFLMPHSPEDATRPALAGADSDRSENPGVAFEPSDWAPGPIALIYVGTMVLVVISSLVLIAAYPNSLPDVGRTVRIAPPGPRLQTDPRGDLEHFRAEEDKRFRTYYWINKSQGIVHIPIEQAMRKLATTGIPGFPKGPQ
jgi:hypothetical protein